MLREKQNYFDNKIFQLVKKYDQIISHFVGRQWRFCDRNTIAILKSKPLGSFHAQHADKHFQTVSHLSVNQTRPYFIIENLNTFHPAAIDQTLIVIYFMIFTERPLKNSPF